MYGFCGTWKVWGMGFGSESLPNQKMYGLQRGMGFWPVWVNAALTVVPHQTFCLYWVMFLSTTASTSSLETLTMSYARMTHSVIGSLSPLFWIVTIAHVSLSCKSHLIAPMVPISHSWLLCFCQTMFAASSGHLMCPTVFCFIGYDSYHKNLMLKIPNIHPKWIEDLQ